MDGKKLENHYFSRPKVPKSSKDCQCMLYSIRIQSYVVAGTMNIYFFFLYSYSRLHIGFRSISCVSLSPGPGAIPVTFFSWWKARVQKNKPNWARTLESDFITSIDISVAKVSHMTKYRPKKKQWILVPWFNLSQIR